MLVVDVQESFRKHIEGFDAMVKNIVIMVEAAKILSVPVIVTEQYPKGLGHTVAEITNVLGDHQLFEKSCFSCCRADDFVKGLESTQRRSVLVTGIEAHVCVNQTVHDLLQINYAPHLITDAISSRTSQNKQIGIEKMLSSGAHISSVEMSLFEMLVESGTDEFKAVQRLVK
ncbi:MAG TPA: hydrolase [Drouetiella sp.]